jgi:hypothetical protein
MGEYSQTTVNECSLSDRAYKKSTKEWRFKGPFGSFTLRDWMFGRGGRMVKMEGIFSLETPQTSRLSRVPSTRAMHWLQWSKQEAVLLTDRETKGGEDRARNDSSVL